MRKLQAWTKLRAKTVTKAAECKLIKFFLLAIARSNSPLCSGKQVDGIYLKVQLKARLTNKKSAQLFLSYIPGVGHTGTCKERWEEKTFPHPLPDPNHKACLQPVKLWTEVKTTRNLSQLNFPLQSGVHSVEVSLRKHYY